MPRTPLHKLVRPRFPPAAVGIESNSASVVQLDRARGGWVVRRAASVNLPAELIKPGFDRTNISDQTEAARTLEDLVTSAGLLRQRKFSASLPEAATRSAIVTIEGAATSRRETEELFEWKVERSFGAPLSELRVSREQMAPDAQRQNRYLVNAIRLHRGAQPEFHGASPRIGDQVSARVPVPVRRSRGTHRRSAGGARGIRIAFSHTEVAYGLNSPAARG